MNYRIRGHRGASGYSLAELLVVVAIIGIVSLVSVPSFITAQRSGRLKSAMRQFMNDTRAARQLAVAQHSQTKIGFTVGTSATNYTIYKQNGSTWTQIGKTRTMEKGCYVANQTNFVTDRDTNASDYDLVFRPDGTVVFNSGVYEGTVVVASEFTNLPKRQYTVQITFSGSMKAI